MRLGVISDVHGNRHALQTVLRALHAAGVDRIVCAGDLVGWGPDPNACVELVAAEDAVVVAGNHELIVLDRLSDERCSSLARQTQHVTRELLRDDVRAWLGQLPLRARLGDVVVAHGSLQDPEQYVRSTTDATAQLESLRSDHRGARVLVLGHTHLPWVFSSEHGTQARSARRTVPLDGGLHLVNPGSVGQSRTRERVPHARFAIVDTDPAVVRLVRTTYDVAAARAAAARAGLPRESVHAPPHSPTRLLRRLRDRVTRGAETTPPTTATSGVPGPPPPRTR